jgi:hypothetical protein
MHEGITHGRKTSIRSVKRQGGAKSPSPGNSILIGFRE